MNIINFTPISAFAGGSLIGFAAFLFFVFNGRIAGISSISSGVINNNENRIDNILFLLGLIIGPIIYSLTGNEIVSILTNSMPLLIIGSISLGFALFNVVGGFLVTNRMLEMFRKKNE